MENNKTIYSIVSAIMFIILIIIIPWILYNISNGGFLFWFISIPLWIVSIILILKSFHETKRDIYALAFAFGELVCVLDEGTSYVPFGFLKNSVQEYTAADLNFNETINVIKLEDSEDDSFSLEDENDKRKEIKYKMHIKFEGPLFIDGKAGAVTFFEKTGMSSFLPKKKTIAKDDYAFYNNFASDISSDFDTISADWGYARFRRKTDWTLKEIIEESGKISKNNQSNLKDTLEKYGLDIGKIATYTKFEKGFEDLLTEPSKLKVKRKNEVFNAKTQREVDIIQGETQNTLNADRIIKEGEARAKTKEADLKVTREGYEKAIGILENSSIKTTDEQKIQTANLMVDLFTNEHLFVVGGPDGKQLDDNLIAMLVTFAGNMAKAPKEKQAGMLEDLKSSLKNK